MGYGLKILSANGSVQLDTDQAGGSPSIYQLVARSSGSFTSTAPAANGDWVSSTPQATGVTDSSALFFVRPVYGSGTNDLQSGNSVSVCGFTSGGSLTIKTSDNINFEWAVFARAPSIGNTPSPGDYGLVVYDGAGTADSNIIFNGFDTRAMRIKGSQAGQGTVSAGGASLWALVQSKFSNVRAASYYNNGFAYQWCATFTNDANKDIGHSTEQVWYRNATGTGDPEGEPPETYFLPQVPIMLVAEIDE